MLVEIRYFILDNKLQWYPGYGLYSCDNMKIKTSQLFSITRLGEGCIKWQ